MSRARFLHILPGIVVGAVFAALVASAWWFQDDLSIVLASTFVFAVYAWLIVIGSRRLKKSKRGPNSG